MVGFFRGLAGTGRGLAGAAVAGIHIEVTPTAPECSVVGRGGTVGRSAGRRGLGVAGERSTVGDVRRALTGDGSSSDWAGKDVGRSSAVEAGRWSAVEAGRS